MSTLRFLALSLALGLGTAALFLGVGFVFVGEFPIVAVVFFEPALWLQAAALGRDFVLPGFGIGDEAQYNTTLVIGLLLWWAVFTLLAMALLLLARVVRKSSSVVKQSSGQDTCIHR